jgi:hypothetical protein
MDTTNEADAKQQLDNARTDVCISAGEAELITERLHYIFRLAGDNQPAKELKKLLIDYRLGMKSE